MKTILIKTFTTVLLIAACGNSFATTGTKVSLGGGAVGPKGELAVNLNQLKPGVDYAIQCGITATAATKMHFVLDGAVFTYQNVIAKLNGVTLGNSLASGATGSLNANENILMITSFTRSTQFSENAPVSLRFLNLDDTAKETVHDCFADPI